MNIRELIKIEAKHTICIRGHSDNTCRAYLKSVTLWIIILFYQYPWISNCDSSFWKIYSCTTIIFEACIFKTYKAYSGVNILQNLYSWRLLQNMNRNFVLRGINIKRKIEEEISKKNQENIRTTGRIFTPGHIVVSIAHLCIVKIFLVSKNASARLLSYFYLILTLLLNLSIVLAWFQHFF